VDEGERSRRKESELSHGYGFMEDPQRKLRGGRRQEEEGKNQKKKKPWLYGFMEDLQKNVRGRRRKKKKKEGIRIKPWLWFHGGSAKNLPGGRRQEEEEEGRKESDEAMAMVSWRILHDMVEIPEDCVVVEVCRRIEPEHDALLSLAMAAGEHVGLQDQRLPARVPQEFEVELVMIIADRRELQKQKKQKKKKKKKKKKEEHK
jgi:hypothetical protein